MSETVTTGELGCKPEQVIAVELMDPADVSSTGAWQLYVTGNDKATLCHSLRWLRIIKKTYGHRPVYLIARDGAGRIVGVLPSFCIKSRIFGSSLMSMPFLDYGGACADDTAVSRCLMVHALRFGASLGAENLELRQFEAPAAAGSLRLDKFAMLLDLARDPEVLWQSISGKARNQVRKAIKSGLSVEVDGIGYLEEFYRVFAVNMRDLGSPVHHPDFFLNIYAEFGDEAKLLVIRDGRSVVGGLVCLFDRDSIVVPWASSLRQYFHKCPNNLLYWEAIRIACSHGCRRFDFGRSSVGSGTYHFKLQWGARPVQIYWHALPTNGAAAADSHPSNPERFDRAVKLWKMLPVALTRLFGPQIRKYITN